MIDAAFPALSNAIGHSLLWRSGAAIVNGFAAAWRTSATGRVFESARALANVRTVAWIAVIGGLLALAGQTLVPAYVRPGLPVIWPAAAIVAAGIVAIGAAAFQRAWPHALLARLMAPRRHER